MLNDYLSLNFKKRILLCHTLAGNKCEYVHIDENPRKTLKIKSETPKKSIDELVI